MNFLSRVKNNTFLAAFVCKIMFLSLENEIHIFTPPCTVISYLNITPPSREYAGYRLVIH